MASLQQATGPPSNIQVALRVRPLLDFEPQKLAQFSYSSPSAAPSATPSGASTTFHYHSSRLNRHLQQNFDVVFSPVSEQDNIYTESCSPIIASWIKGYNCSIFAYGQTGSGKTFTLGLSQECTVSPWLFTCLDDGKTASSHDQSSSSIQYTIPSTINAQLKHVQHFFQFVLPLQRELVFQLYSTQQSQQLLSYITPQVPLAGILQRSCADIFSQLNTLHAQQWAQMKQFLFENNAITLQPYRPSHEPSDMSCSIALSEQPPASGQQKTLLETNQCTMTTTSGCEFDDIPFPVTFNELSVSLIEIFNNDIYDLLSTVPEFPIPTIYDNLFPSHDHDNSCDLSSVPSLHLLQNTLRSFFPAFCQRNDLSQSSMLHPNTSQSTPSSSVIPMSSSITQVKLRELASGETEVQGARVLPIHNNILLLFTYIYFGIQSRTTASTNMNATSSRSHCILTLHMKTTTFYPGMHQQKTSTTSSTTTSSVLSSLYPSKPTILNRKLYFIDLAGSERIEKTGAQGDVLKQGISINSSLSALSKVISRLVQRQVIIDTYNEQQIRYQETIGNTTMTSTTSSSSTSSAAQNGSDESGAAAATAPPAIQMPNLPHIPYRDSTITRLLKDSLDGHNLTLLIACLSPAVSNIDESIQTAQFASQMRGIKTLQAKVNKDKTSAQFDVFRDEIKRLQLENNVLKDRLGLSPTFSLQNDDIQAYNTLSNGMDDLGGAFPRVGYSSQNTMQYQETTCLSTTDKGAVGNQSNAWFGHQDLSSLSCNNDLYGNDTKSESFCRQVQTAAIDAFSSSDQSHTGQDTTIPLISLQVKSDIINSQDDQSASNHNPQKSPQTVSFGDISQQQTILMNVARLFKCQSQFLQSTIRQALDSDTVGDQSKLSSALEIINASLQTSGIDQFDTDHHVDESLLNELAMKFGHNKPTQSTDSVSTSTDMTTLTPQKPMTFSEIHMLSPTGKVSVPEENQEKTQCHFQLSDGEHENRDNLVELPPDNKYNNSSILENVITQLNSKNNSSQFPIRSLFDSCNVYWQYACTLHAKQQSVQQSNSQLKLSLQSAQAQIQQSKQTIEQQSQLIAQHQRDQQSLPAPKRRQGLNSASTPRKNSAGSVTSNKLTNQPQTQPQRRQRIMSERLQSANSKISCLFAEPTQKQSTMSGPSSTIETIKQPPTSSTDMALQTPQSTTSTAPRTKSHENRLVREELLRAHQAFLREEQRLDTFQTTISQLELTMNQLSQEDIGQRDEISQLSQGLTQCVETWQEQIAHFHQLQQLQRNFLQLFECSRSISSQRRHLVQEEEAHQQQQQSMSSPHKNNETTGATRVGVIAKLKQQLSQKESDFLKLRQNFAALQQQQQQQRRQMMMIKGQQQQLPSSGTGLSTISICGKGGQISRRISTTTSSNTSITSDNNQNMFSLDGTMNSLFSSDVSSGDRSGHLLRTIQQLQVKLQQLQRNDDQKRQKERLAQVISQLKQHEVDKKQLLRTLRQTSMLNIALQRKVSQLTSRNGVLDTKIGQLQHQISTLKQNQRSGGKAGGPTTPRGGISNRTAYAQSMKQQHEARQSKLASNAYGLDKIPHYMLGLNRESIAPLPSAVHTAPSTSTAASSKSSQFHGLRSKQITSSQPSQANAADTSISVTTATSRAPILRKRRVSLRNAAAAAAATTTTTSAIVEPTPRHGTVTTREDATTLEINLLSPTKRLRVSLSPTNQSSERTSTQAQNKAQQRVSLDGQPGGTFFQAEESTSTQFQSTHDTKLEDVSSKPAEHPAGIFASPRHGSNSMSMVTKPLPTPLRNSQTSPWRRRLQNTPSLQGRSIQQQQQQQQSASGNISSLLSPSHQGGEFGNDLFNVTNGQDEELFQMHNLIESLAQELGFTDSMLGDDMSLPQPISSNSRTEKHNAALPPLPNASTALLASPRQPMLRPPRQLMIRTSLANDSFDYEDDDQEERDTFHVDISIPDVHKSQPTQQTNNQYPSQYEHSAVSYIQSPTQHKSPFMAQRTLAQPTPSTTISHQSTQHHIEDLGFSPLKPPQSTLKLNATVRSPSLRTPRVFASTVNNTTDKLAQRGPTPMSPSTYINKEN